METIGEHQNIIRKEEYHSNTQGHTYMALEYAKAKCLFHYLVYKEPNIVRGNEKWTRYLFRQFIAGLQQMHSQSIAHLDLKIDNVLLDIVEIDGGFLELNLKIADFGMSVFGDLQNVTSRHGACYTPPEVLYGKNPYDGEKADVWASTFILLALYAANRFSDKEQCKSRYYREFVDTGSL